jgi:hypothetical protein
MSGLTFGQGIAGKLKGKLVFVLWSLENNFFDFRKSERFVVCFWKELVLAFS